MQWVSAWGYRITDFGLFPLMIQNETQRIIIRHNCFAKSVRVEFSNRYGRHPLPITHASIAIAAEDGSILPESSVDLTHHGAGSFVLKPGETFHSDPVPFVISPAKKLAISLFVEPQTAITGACSSQSRIITTVKNSKSGDLCNESDFHSYDQHDYFVDFLSQKPLYTCFYGITEVEMLTEENVKTVAVFGDSITQQGHWSEAFTEMLYNAAVGKRTVINHGICGNRLLHDSSTRGYFGNYFGEAGVLRFEDDVFRSHPSRVDYVIARLGINDLIQPRVLAPQYESVSAEELISGLSELADTAHRHNTKVFTTTSTPYKGYMGTEAWTEEDERTRNAVDSWIRTENNRFDGYFDFEMAVADPDNVQQLREDLHLGDLLHPNEKGGRLMAETIPLALFLDDELSENRYERQ